MMEKYGVQDRAVQQKAELAKVRLRIKQLGRAHEKTAAVQQEMTKLKQRESELNMALAAL